MSRYAILLCQFRALTKQAPKRISRVSILVVNVPNENEPLSFPAFMYTDTYLQFKWICSHGFAAGKPKRTLAREY